MPRRKTPLPELARLDTATPEANLFHVSQKGSSASGPVEYRRTTDTEDGPLEIEIVSSYSLDYVDLKVFLAIVGIAVEQFEALTPSASDDSHTALWAGLAAHGNALGFPGARFQTTARQIALTAGMGYSTNQRLRIFEALRRLRYVGSTWTRDGIVVSGYNMLSYAADLKNMRGPIVGLLSPHLAKQILRGSAQWIQVSLEEVRQLRNPAATVLHLYLSGQLGIGDAPERRMRTVRRRIDTLCEMVYGDLPKNDSQARDRRRNVKEGLRELNRLGHWHVEYDESRHMVTISRAIPNYLGKLLDLGPGLT